MVSLKYDNIGSYLFQTPPSSTTSASSNSARRRRANATASHLRRAVADANVVRPAT